MMTLREFKAEDVHFLLEYLNNPLVYHYLSTRIPQPYTEQDALWWINQGSRDGIVCAIEWDGLMVGSIGVHPNQFEFSKSAAVGYWLAQSHWGKGIATSALEQLTERVFNTTDIVRLYAHVFDGNIASIKVLQKCGYILEGMLRKAIFKNDGFLDAYLYARIKD
jgi:[ribosomal protein S5]-alanine N-acetyltransferase